MSDHFAPKLWIFLVLACLLLTGTAAFSQTAPFGFLDSAADSNGKTTLPSSATLSVSGWAADYQDFAPVAKVQVFIDGKLAKDATRGIARSDVAAYLGDAAYTNSGWSASISLLSYAAGTHTVTAVATNSLTLTTTLTNALTFTIVVPDLSASAVTTTGTPAAGGTLQVTDTTTNLGLLASTTSATRFYLNTTAVRGGTLLGSRNVAALAPSAFSGPITTTVTLASNISGLYYIVACANDTNTNSDSNTANNCAASPQITVGGPDLSESLGAVPANGVAGGAILVSDTLTNAGSGAAGYSQTRYYLNTTNARGGTLLGNRTIASLGPAALSGPISTSLTLPSSINGNYFLVACANDTNTVPDSNSANNCQGKPIAIGGADLAEFINASIPAALAGSTIQVTDTVQNQGTGTAGYNVTKFYLNTTASRGGSLLGSRTIASLAPGAASGPITTTLTLPTNLTNGQTYVVVACANDTNTIAETSTANNCWAQSVGVYTASKTVVVNPAAALPVYDAATCGGEKAACKTIVDGVNRAVAGQTVLVSPGTYLEQVTITKNINLVSSLKYQAVIQAPANTKLAADGDNHQTLVTITGGATAVTVQDMKIAGPIFTESCSDNIFGVYVKNANATLTGNFIDKPQHADPNQWGCQSGIGIRFGSTALGYVGHTGTITGNVITAPAKGGIVVDGTNTAVNVTANSIQGLNVVGIVGQNGIQISRGAKGTIDGNSISGFRYGPNFSSLSAAGILVYNAAGGVTITNNTVSGNDEGIAVYHDPTHLSGGGPDFTVQYPTNTTIKKNTASNNVYLGIHIDPFSTGNTIWNNTATGNSGGWDELDEHPDFNSNNWGTDASNFNTVGTVWSGLVFQY